MEQTLRMVSPCTWPAAEAASATEITPDMTTCSFRRAPAAGRPRPAPGLASSARAARDELGEILTRRFLPHHHRKPSRCRPPSSYTHIVILAFRVRWSGRLKNPWMPTASRSWLRHLLGLFELKEQLAVGRISNMYEIRRDAPQRPGSSRHRGRMPPVALRVVHRNTLADDSLRGCSRAPWPAISRCRPIRQGAPWISVPIASSI